MVKSRWNVRRADPKLVDSLCEKLEVDPLVAQILIHRGLADAEQAAVFLNPRLEDLHDPSLMLGVDRVVARILKARDRHEKVLIYGDYDVDGITSTAVLKRALEMVGIEVDFYLPRRLEEGYGLKTEVIKRAHEQGFSLVITADSGIRAFEVCAAARELGLDLVVTDHHLPDTRLPDAWAIVNPRQPACKYPDKNLAAVGVVFKLVQALFRQVGRQNVVHHFLKLVAIGTIADLVPLVGENRTLTRFGLDGLASPRNLGLKALLEGAGVGERISPFDIGFKVAPRINAVTRMGGGREVVDLFSVKDSQTAKRIVEEMNSKNLLRRATEQGILEGLEEQLDRHPEQLERKFVVLSGQNWHRGVIGIVASRIVDRCYRPTLILSLDENGAQGSGRSVPGFHILDALTSCRDLFAKFGGHAQAVGCTLTGPNLESKVTRLEERLEEYAREHLSDDLLVPSLDIDAILPVEQLSFSLLDKLEQLSPFGMGNPVPVFASQSAPLAAGPFLIKEKHLKLYVGTNGHRLEAIWWQNGSVAASLEQATSLDLAYTLSREVYMGETKLLLTIEDLRAV